MDTLKAYCISKIENSEKCYMTSELKYWTTNPVFASFYDNLEDAKYDLKYHLDKDEYAYQYMIEHNPTYKKPEYKIEEVEIKFLTE